MFTEINKTNGELVKS